jgi:hypothetical protein
VAESIKQVTFVTRELPTDQSVEGLVVARIIESLPLEWKVKVFVIRSWLLLSPAFPALPEVETIVISEPQYKWDNFFLRALRYPLEKLATKETLQISKRILTDSSKSEFFVVFSTGPALKSFFRALASTNLDKKRFEEFNVSGAQEGEISFQVFREQGGNWSEHQSLALSDKVNGNYFSLEALDMEASEVFDFNASRIRKHASKTDATIKIVDTASANKIGHWGLPSQLITTSGILVLSSKLALILNPISILRKIHQSVSPNLIKALNAVFKFAYALLKSIFHALRIVRKTVSSRR